MYRNFSSDTNFSYEFFFHSFNNDVVEKCLCRNFHKYFGIIFILYLIHWKSYCHKNIWKHYFNHDRIQVQHQLGLDLILNIPDFYWIEPLVQGLLISGSIILTLCKIQNVWNPYYKCMESILAHLSVWISESCQYWTREIIFSCFYGADWKLKSRCKIVTSRDNDVHFS